MTGDLGTDDLILSHFSLGRFLPFEQRVRAAADAGYAGIGLYLGDYLRLRAEGESVAGLRAVLDAHGVRVVELEALRGWTRGGAEGARYRQAEQDVLAMNDAVGPAETVQVIGPFDGSLDDAAEAFAGVCDRVGEHGLRAAIEFLPEMTNIPDAATAWEIVHRAGRANGGLCVDSWHHFRGADDDAMLRAVPAERVFTVQFNDGTRSAEEPDYYTDCTRNRRAPGEGEFDLTGFLRLLRDSGVERPLSVEVLSTDLLRRPPEDVAVHLAERTRAVVRSARRVGTP